MAFFFKKVCFRNIEKQMILAGKLGKNTEFTFDV